MQNSGVRRRARQPRKIKPRGRRPDALDTDPTNGRPNAQRAQDNTGFGHDCSTDQTTSLTALRQSGLSLAEIAANIGKHSTSSQMFHQSRITRRRIAAMRKAGGRQPDANRRDGEAAQHKLEGRSLHGLSISRSRGTFNRDDFAPHLACHKDDVRERPVNVSRYWLAIWG